MDNSTPDKKLKLVFKAFVRDENNNTLIEKEVSLDKALPRLEDVDLCTKSGFIRDVDTLESAIIKVDGQLRQEISEAYMQGAAEKKKHKNR